jgi:hypothetical protein
MDVLGFCCTSRLTPLTALPAAEELPFLKVIPLENPVGDNGDTRLVCRSLSLLGKYVIEDCRRPFLTLLAPNGDKGPVGESVIELCKAGEREAEESTELEASWSGRGPGYIMFNE